MASLSFVHLLYLGMILLFLVVMACRKSIVIPCALGIVFLGAVITKSATGAIQALFSALVWAGTEFWGIILVISLVVAMSKSLASIGADRLLVQPLKKHMVNRSATFLILGLVMFVISLCIWPSPAVALVGALLLPIAVGTGIPVLWAAVAMNLFGHGMALSGDFFIQGAPTITAKAAGSDVGTLMSHSVLLWAVMCAVTLAVAFFQFRREIRTIPVLPAQLDAEEQAPARPQARFMAIVTPVVFLADMLAMLCFGLQGGDATALIGGSAFLLLVLCACLDKGVASAFDDTSDYLKEGFGFGIQIFAPVIVIGGFFFLGSEDAAQAVFGGEATGILSDIGSYLAANVPVGRVSATLTQALIAVITGLDGSGFSGLPLVGATAATFAGAIPIQKETLAAMGQIVTIWVGGGTLIPWAVIPVAAICNVSPVELVRKNFFPVVCGLAATIILTMFLL